MIIPLAIVMVLQQQGKSSDLESRLDKAVAAFGSHRTGSDLSNLQYNRSNALASAEFEDLAVKAGSQPIAVEAWILALASAPKNLRRENRIIDKIMLVKTVGKKQFASVFPYAVFMACYSNCFATGSRVVKVVDLLVDKAPNKDFGSSLLIEKANGMDDINDLKWDIYNRLVEQYAGTDAAKRARTILLSKKNLQRGDQFPDFISKDSNGKKFQLSTLRGKVVVLEFWANWCPSCQRTIPVMQGVEKEFVGQPVEFVGINSDGDAPVVRELQTKWGMTTRTLVDGSPTGPISTRYAIMAWPSFFVIGKDGKVVFRSSGIDAAGMANAIREATKS